jgi:hypothetical protein
VDTTGKTAVKALAVATQLLPTGTFHPQSWGQGEGGKTGGLPWHFAFGCPCFSGFFNNKFGEKITYP